MDKLNLKPLPLIVGTSLKTIYKKEQRKLDYRFGRAVNGWISNLEYDMTQDKDLVDDYTKLNKNDTCGLRQLGRLVFGNNGLGFKISPAKTGLSSRASLQVKGSECTSDHIVGVTLAGWEIHTKIKELFDKGEPKETIVNMMVKNWLSDNLHLWVEAKITKEEHKKENLARDEHTLQEKLDLIHYDQGNIQLLQYSK